MASKLTQRNKSVAKEVTVNDIPEDPVPKFVVPDLTIKDLLNAIPPHCFERNYFRSFAYVIADFAALAAFLWAALTYIPQINPDNFSLPHPYLYPALRFVAWGVYSFFAGAVGTGLWVCAHECGHQAFSTSKTANNITGWVLHSALGVPYHSWRISHAKHHAQTSHLTGDQVFVPKTRSEYGLPPRDPEQENLEGTKVSPSAQAELMEAFNDSPIVGVFWVTVQLLFGWPAYLLMNTSGQTSYPKWTNHFIPKGPIYAPHQYASVIWSDIGVAIWLAGLVWSVQEFGVLNVFRIYFLPYLWVNHWLVLITFLQHTDPALPHYQASSFTFPRGALATFDRELMGGHSFWGHLCNSFMATATHGISETHVAHHIASKIPHYHAWDAKVALEKRLATAGIEIQGNPGTWAEALRVWRECKFIEDEGEVRFYKNSRGKAARVPVFSSDYVSDSGIEMK